MRSHSSNCLTAAAAAFALCAVTCSEAVSAYPDDGGCRPDSGCLTFCDDSLCAPRTECDSPIGSCRPVYECGRLPQNGCANETDVCDPRAGKCYPGNGDCSGGRGCPPYSPDVLAIASVGCGATDGICHVTPRQDRPQWLADVGPGLMTVDKPACGAAIATSAALAIHWAPSGAPVLVRVVDRYPATKEAFEQGMVWGASGAATASSVTFADGHRYAGDWIEGSPDALSPGVYYAIVVQVSLGQARATSVPVPFAIGGAAWLAAGQACATPGVPGDCFNPARAMGCINGRCAPICASDVDCDMPQRCGTMTDGVRACAP